MVSVNPVFQPSYKRSKLIEVRANYTYTAGINFFKKGDFGDYPPVASACVTDWETLVESKTQTVQP